MESLVTAGRASRAGKESGSFYAKKRTDTDSVPFYQRIYAQQDANWNTTAVMDYSTGKMLERFEYDPYGNLTVLDTTTGKPTGGGGSTTGWRYFFQGGRQDLMTGWYLFGARDYIPAEARWSERDPLGQAAGDPDVYGFVGEDPVNSVEPDRSLERRPVRRPHRLRGRDPHRHRAPRRVQQRHLPLPELLSRPDRRPGPGR